MKIKAFQAYAKGHGSWIGATPREAASQFFTRNPKARKCNVIEGIASEHFFSVSCGPVWPQTWKDVTRKTLDTLPVV